MGNICSSCGSENLDDARFCKGCGSDLSKGVKTAPSAVKDAENIQKNTVMPPAGAQAPKFGASQSQPNYQQQQPNYQQQQQPNYQQQQFHPQQQTQYAPNYFPRTPKDKTVAGILGILLGGIGVHKFYMEKIGIGILYLIFCWTFIPAIVGFIEGIIYLVEDDVKFQRRINPGYIPPQIPMNTSY